MIATRNERRALGTLVTAMIMLASAERAYAGTADFICTGVAVGVQYDADDVFRLICSNSAPGGISQFVIHGATSKAASHALAIALVARAGEKQLYLRYRAEPDALPGCDPALCRELLWIGDWGH